MSAIIHHQSSIIHRERGVALLLVLLIIMAITILSLGFLSRCDTELACGQNMLLRTQMDQLADSALEHARGLDSQSPGRRARSTGPGPRGSRSWRTSPDFYDVNVTRDDSNPNERRNYSITCEAYRDEERPEGGEQPPVGPASPGPVHRAVDGGGHHIPAEAHSLRRLLLCGHGPGPDGATDQRGCLLERR